MTYKVRLTNKTELAEGTMAFYFEKPKDFQFQPGQSVDLTLIAPPETDGEGNRRAFSIDIPLIATATSLACLCEVDLSLMEALTCLDLSKFSKAYPYSGIIHSL